MSPSRHDTMPRLMDACAGNAEVLALSVLRMLAAGYSTGDVACWDMAYTGAERVLCPMAAGQFVGSMTTLIRAVRRCCAQGCSFMPATCCRVTKDEKAILNLIATARLGDRGALADAVSALVGGRPAGPLATAARIAAASLDDIGPGLGLKGEGSMPSHLH